MSHFVKNLGSSFLAKGWTAIDTVVMTPIYLKFLGPEGYGLIGFYLSLRAILVISDFGLTSAFNREVARLSSVGGKEADIRDTVRSLEIAYLVIMVALTLIVYSLGGVLSRNWLQTTMPASDVAWVLRLMGVALGVQMTATFYNGGMFGLQRHVRANLIVIVCGVLRSVGVMLILWLLSPTIHAFFLWQVVGLVVQAFWARATLWSLLPLSDRAARFRADILQGIRRYAVGWFGLTVASSVLLQMDKVLLSRLLTLEMFGYYSLAWTVAQTPVTMLTSPVQQVVYPQFSQLVSRGEHGLLSQAYHRASQLVAAVTIPLALLVGLFAPELLLIWLGNPVTVAEVAPFTALLVIGSSMWGLYLMPHTLQLAHGWTSLGLVSSTIGVLVIVPLLLVLPARYGPIGASLPWVVVNIGFMLVTVSFMHRKLLRGERWRWYARDILRPFLAASIPAVIGRWLFPTNLSSSTTIVLLGAIWMVTTGFAVVAAPSVRTMVSEFLRSLRPASRWVG